MIVLSGTVGAGKTSLTKILANHFYSNAILESVNNNPILPLFYKDPRRYAFLLQIYFLNKRLVNIKEAQKNRLNIIDRSIYEDQLLFKLNVDLGRATQTEYKLYNSLFHNMMEKHGSMPKKNPDLLIYIHVSFSNMLRHIKKRGRPYEQIDIHPELFEYYKKLTNRYEVWYHKYKESPKIQINGNINDFVYSKIASQRVIRKIDERLKQIGILNC